MALQARQIIVHGRVQGVGFRYFVQRAGNRLGLAGNVRNRRDSTVEIMVEGEPDLIDEFVAEVRKGPALARVMKVDVNEIAPAGGFRTFQIEGW